MEAWTRTGLYTADPADESRRRVALSTLCHVRTQLAARSSHLDDGGNAQSLGITHCGGVRHAEHLTTGPSSHDGNRFLTLQTRQRHGQSKRQ